METKHNKVKAHPSVHMMALETASLVVVVPPPPRKRNTVSLFSLDRKEKGHSIFSSDAEAEKVSK